MSEHQLGQFASWEIINEDIVRKTCDKSFFKYHGSGVSQEIRWFFDAENLPVGQSKIIVLVYDGLEYEVSIRMDNSSGTRIFWNDTLAEKFESYSKDDIQYALEFHRIERGRFNVQFVELPSVGKRKSSRLLSGKNDEWWPALEDYTPGITKEQWIEILNAPDYVGSVWCGVLARFYDYGGAATCSQIADKYGGSAMSVRSCCTQLAKAIQKATGCELYDDGDDRNRYWPILFQGRKATSGEKGSYVWKLRPELKEALDEVGILRFLQEEGEPEMQMTIKEIINQVKSYIAAEGFIYEGGLIENLYLSLKSKPFVILAGTSGTGKTRLVKLFAEAIGAEYKMVSVRPDWSDGSDLFGHTDLNGKFINGPICAAFDSAIAEPTRPVLLCLDEMNLARVEYYLSDFLSVIESRDKDDSGKVVTDQIAQYDSGIPDNLYIVGTVNMDETTFPFSKKVLDRANTIEFG